MIAEELAPQVPAVELTQIAGPPTYERGWRQKAVKQVVQVANAEQEAGRTKMSPAEAAADVVAWCRQTLD